MKDIVSINRQFFIIARQRAQVKHLKEDLITGLSSTVLEKLASLSMDEIETLAASNIAMFTLRISEKQIDTILSNTGVKRAAYLVASMPNPPTNTFGAL